MSFLTNYFPWQKLVVEQPNQRAQPLFNQRRKNTQAASPATTPNIAERLLKFGLPLLLIVTLVVLLANAAGQSAVKTYCDKAAKGATESTPCKMDDTPPGPLSGLQLRSL